MPGILPTAFAVSTTVTDDFLRFFDQIDQSFRLETIHQRTQLPESRRALLTLAMVAGKCQADAVPEHVRMCVRAGLGKTEIGETLLQVYCYAGVYAALSSFTAARATLETMQASGELTPSQQAVANEPAPASTVQERAAAGLRKRRELFGDADVDRNLANADPFTDLFWDTTLDFCFGNIWSRPQFDRQLRSELCLAIASAAGQMGAVDRHVRSAIRGGVTIERIGEIFLLAYVYGGVHNSRESFGIARKVLAELAAG
jgi:alkylhydroperoxidase/carboxymuconolactone decarboxylase family protein YurZ